MTHETIRTMQTKEKEMKTASLKGENLKISYKTNTGMYTLLTSPTGRTARYGADVYTFDDTDEYIVLVATSHNGSTLKSTTTVITTDEYSKFTDLDDPYNDYKFHYAVMAKLGF